MLDNIKTVEDIDQEIVKSYKDFKKGYISRLSCEQYVDKLFEIKRELQAKK